ncbi:MAG: glucosyltransferase domain-containing protein [Eubacteriales bacterium]
MTFDLLLNLKKKLKKQYSICFITGIIIGFITHGYMLMNKLPNWDDVYNVNSYGSGAFIGRWLLPILHPFGGSLSVPAVHGFLAIVFLSLSACMVLAMLDLKSVTAAVLVPMLMVTFPSVASTMTFMFTIHVYGLSIFMITLAVYLLRIYKFGGILSGILLICSMGIYQSYISIAIALILMGLILDCIRGKEVTKIFKHGIMSAVVLGISTMAYIRLCYLIYPNLGNETYAGVGDMGEISFSRLPVLIARCYNRVLEYFIYNPFEFVTPLMWVMNIATCILAVGLFIYLIIARKLYKNKLSCALSCLFCFFMPLAVAFVYFMAPDAPHSMLMLYAYVMVYILVIGLLECCINHWQVKRWCKQWKVSVAKTTVLVTVLVMFLSCYSNYLISNTSYLRMDLAYERVSSYYNRIIASVESQEGFENGDRIAIYGEFHYATNPSPIEATIEGTEGLRDLSGVAFENGLLTSGVRNSFIETYLGIDMGEISLEEQEEIMESKEYQEMEIYPTEGAIQKIGDVWVVKVCE